MALPRWMAITNLVGWALAVGLGGNLGDEVGCGLAKGSVMVEGQGHEPGGQVVEALHERLVLALLFLCGQGGSSCC